MKLKLSEVQVEQVGVTCLDKLHHDIGLELVENAINGGSGLEPDEVQAMLRILVSIEVVMKELMHPDIYFVWKLESGVDL
tara:strand:- start:125 stop:364 length:240 start_codon:yes stop_codon:yes gene_type:complete